MTEVGDELYLRVCPCDAVANTAWLSPLTRCGEKQTRNLRHECPWVGVRVTVTEVFADRAALRDAERRR